MIFGGGLLVVFAVFAMLVAAVGKIAQSRGRSAAIWVLCAAGAGIAAFVLGLAVFAQAVSDDDSSTAVALLSVLAPPAFMVAAMAGIWLYIHRAPVKVSQRDAWTVHFIGRGDGTINITADEVRFEWSDGSQTLRRGELEKIEADGECVRIHANNLELAILPIGNPNTEAGRRQQSQVLARRLRAPLPTARIS